MIQEFLKKASNSSRRGFTLIELSIVVVIIGIIISALATVLPSLIVSSKIKKARAILEKIDYAIIGYAIANNRLPFAASATDGIESNDVFNGYLPFKTLGLSSGQDPWGNEIRYTVYGTAGGANNLTDIFADADAFCTALVQASTAAFDGALAHTTTAATCAAADSTNSSNQAYIIISGGAKDLDGANGFPDACNGDTSATFNAPNKIMDTGYDDMVRAFSLNELIQRVCNGSGGSGGSGSSAGEDTYTNGCTNGVDDDGDGSIDCSDSDCAADAACSSPGSVSITTTTIPTATLNTTYTTTVNATGGTSPYQWTLTNNGGFSGLSINSFTGVLSGTADQCPGTYNLIVDVEDTTLAASGGPFTDSATLSLQVVSNLAVTRTSGSGNTVTWSSTLQEETFQATGSWLGSSLNWSLNSGGAAGFSVSALGSDSAVLKKTGATTAGTYTFTITATDASCSSNSANIVLSVTVLSSATGTPGAISGIIATQTYTYPTEAYTPQLISNAGDIYTVSHQTAYNNGYLRTTQIGSDGSITTSEVDSTFFNYSNGSPSAWPALQVHDPDSIKVSDTITAVAFSSSAAGQGYISTISVDASGQVGAGYDQNLIFENVQCSQPDIINVSGDVYAIVYSGPDNDGWIKTVSIDSSTGTMTLTGNSLEFDTSNAYEPKIVQVSDGLFAVAYSSGDSSSGGTGLIKSLAIDSAGAITELGSLSGGFDTTCDEPVLVKVNDTTLAVAYSGPGDDGWLKTINIDATGSLALTGSSLEFDTSDTYEPDMIHLGGDIYALAYCDPRGSGNRRGLVSTVSIASDGTIGTALIDTLQFEDRECYSPSMVKIDTDTAAIFYRGSNNRGTLVTIGFQ